MQLPFEITAINPPILIAYDRMELSMQLSVSLPINGVGACAELGATPAGKRRSALALRPLPLRREWLCILGEAVADNCRLIVVLLLRLLTLHRTSDCAVVTV